MKSEDLTPIFRALAEWPRLAQLSDRSVVLAPVARADATDFAWLGAALAIGVLPQRVLFPAGKRSAFHGTLTASPTGNRSDLHND